MAEWKEYKLRELTTKIGSGATPRGGDNSYKSTGISLIRSQNILDLEFSSDGLAFIDDEQADELSNVTVEEEDVLLNITGDSVARVCKVPESVLPARVNQHVSIIRTDQDKLDSDFLLYQLVSRKDELLSLAEIGATRRALTKGMIEELPVQIPPLPDQRAIASVLSSLDDKIDLLHRQNKTLEALAETVFREWFVRRPELAEGEKADEGWKQSSLYDAIEMVGGGTPKTEVPEFWDGDIKWISGKDTSQNHRQFITNTDKKITSLGLEKSATKVLPQFATVISARGTVGTYCILAEPMAFSQTSYGIKPKFKNCYFFTYLLLAHSVEELKAASYGSIFDTITTNTFREQNINLPPELEIQLFEEKVEPYFTKMLSNQNQIRTLTQLRDTLLPKLMSGEVRVKLP